MKYIKYDISEGIATLQLNKPEKLNALGYDLLRELSKTIDNIASNSEIKCLIIKGNQDSFCAGGDLEYMAKMNKLEAREASIWIQTIFGHIESLPFFTMAIIEGFAFGGGLELALSCDMIIASEHAQFALPEMRYGIIPAGGGTRRFQEKAGYSNCIYNMTATKILNSTEALNLGLIQDTIKQDDIEKFIVSYSTKVKSQSRESILKIKSLLKTSLTSPRKEAFKNEATLFGELIEGDGQKESKLSLNHVINRKSMENFIFTGMGFAPANNCTTNKQIEEAIDKGYLQGFNSERVRTGDSYQAYIKQGGTLSPFEYLAEKKMGFRNRVHVVPFPPVKMSYKHAESSLDLAVKAVDEAINDAGISPDDIDAWIVGTATAHEMAPGMAATLKCYFVPYNNQSQTMTLTSACVGFNINLERAINILQTHPEMKHIVIAHTEVMSELLLDEKDFVPSTTFGDAAAAMILSRSKSNKKEGVLSIRNYEDLRMIDFLGAHKNGNLYMEPRIVKSRAVPNMIRVIHEINEDINWNNDSYDYFLPHQTGHAIVHSVAKAVNVTPKKLFQEVQLKYGNLSGASVPACFYELKNSNRLAEGMKILTAVAGLGGEFGGFAYIVPESNKPNLKNDRLKGKTVFISGATGELACEVAIKCLKEGAKLFLHYRKEGKKSEQLKEKLSKWASQVSYLQADLSQKNEVELLISELKSKTQVIHYVLLSAAHTGTLNRASDVSDEELKMVDHINHRANRIICDELENHIKESIVIVGSVAEDALFSGSSAYVSSKRALHAYAVNLAQKMYNKSVRVVYYMPGVINGGMTSKLNNAQIAMSMQSIGQKKIIPMDDIATRIFKSLFIPKVQGVQAKYEGALMVRRDGYIKE